MDLHVPFEKLMLGLDVSFHGESVVSAGACCMHMRGREHVSLCVRIWAYGCAFIDSRLFLYIRTSPFFNKKFTNPNPTQPPPLNDTNTTKTGRGSFGRNWSQQNLTALNGVPEHSKHGYSDEDDEDDL